MGTARSLQRPSRECSRIPKRRARWARKAAGRPSRASPGGTWWTEPTRSIARSSKSTMRLSAIVVTYNSRRHISACLASLARSTIRPDEIIVIDNNSADGTADFVRRTFPEATLLDFWDNRGFAEGNNRAFRIATGRFWFLLNPDATVAPDCLERLLEVVEKEPRIGVAVPKVLLAREPCIINSAGLNVNGIGYGWDRGFLEWDRGHYDAEEPVVAGSGCAMLL